MATESWRSNIPITTDIFETYTAIPTRLDPVCFAMLGFTDIIEIDEAGDSTAQGLIPTPRASRTQALPPSNAMRVPLQEVAM